MIVIGLRRALVVVGLLLPASRGDQDVEKTPCTYYSVGNDQGCSADEICKIEKGECTLKIGEQEGVCYAPMLICTADWKPVCGCDNTSYANECGAFAAGVNVQYDGCCNDDKECEDSSVPGEVIDEKTNCSKDPVAPPVDVVCPADWNPVCGCDGATYGNECGASAASVNVQYKGCCRDDKDCEDTPGQETATGPVDVEVTPCTYYGVGNDQGCSSDDMCKIKKGKCVLKIREQEGVCYTPMPMCTSDWNPVCGCDNTSYANECGAFAARVNVEYDGCCNDDKDCEDTPGQETATGSTAAAGPSTALSVGAKATEPAEAAVSPDATQPAEAAVSPDATQPTEAAVSPDATQPTEAAVSSNTTQPTEGARSPDATQPTEATPFDPSDPSSGASDKKRFNLGVCLFLASALGFVW